MWTPGADVGGGGSSMTFDDRPVGKSAGGGGGRPQSTGFGGGGGGGGGGGFRGGQPQQSFGGGGGGFRGEQPQSFGANDFGSSFGGASTASISTAGGSKMKKLTVADNFYKRMQDAPGHKAAKKKAPPKSSNAGGMPRRPNFLTCYLCGMQFGKSSLPIHQPQCYYKKLIVWEREDTTIRGPKPIHPDEMGAGMTGGCAGSGAGMNEDQIEEFNNQQYQHYSDNMVSCENCGRTFMPDRLQVHMRSCKPGASGRGSKPVAGKVRPNMQAEDEYELPAHSSARPASPGPRRSASPKPAPAAGLEPCPQCGRRFVAKKIEAHLAICKGPSPSGPNGPRTGYDGNPLPTFEDSLVPCEACGRTFAPDRIQKHISICKGTGAPRKSKTRAVPPRTAPSPEQFAESDATLPMQDDDDEDDIDFVVEEEQAPAPVAAAPSSSPAAAGPKFCQECGHRFPFVPKFCQECGTRV